MTVHVGKGFGRLVAPDVRDYLHPMRAVLRPARVPVHRYYRAGPRLPLDQGPTATAVAHAWTGFLCAAPLMHEHPPDIYQTHQGIVPLDEWVENDREQEATDPREFVYGTSIRAGAKYLQSIGLIKSYLWTRDVDEAATWILAGEGTLVFGTTWHAQMSHPDARGTVTVAGGPVGSHAFLGVGYNRRYKMFRCLNSWGREFGADGRFWIGHDDMQRLLDDDGECCAAIQQFVPSVP
jgi:hypothetical protein